MKDISRNIIWNGTYLYGDSGNPEQFLYFAPNLFGESFTSVGINEGEDFLPLRNISVRVDVSSDQLDPRC